VPLPATVGGAEMSLSLAESMLTDKQVQRSSFDDSAGIVVSIPHGAPIVPDDI
jgi:hypothetical protein